MSSTSLTLAAAPSRPGGRLGRTVREHRPLVAAALTVAVAWAGLVATHTATPPPLSRAAALHQALGDATVARVIAGTGWQRMEVTPEDGHHELLEFLRGSRMVALVTLSQSRHGVSLEASSLIHQRYAYGSGIANDGRVLIGLSVVFVLMTAVWPLWRIRNLDVLACTSLVLSVVLLNRWLLTPMVLVSYPALLYLALRCAWWGLADRREAPSAIPLFDHLTQRWTAPQRLRMLRLAAGAAALIVVMVGITSPNLLDVAYAVLEGATAIVHGLLPYGHVPGILHGDTYPIASYLLYVPFAWMSPVRSTWDNADLSLVVAVAAAFVCALGFWRMASARAAGPRRTELVAGRISALRAVIAWLTFPPLLVTVSTGTSDVALAAILVIAFVLWRRPGWSAGAVSCAAWFKLAPIALVPLLLARLRGRALAWGAAGVLSSSLAMVAVLLVLGGWSGPEEMAHALAYQFTRASPHTAWALVGSVPLQQLAQAAALGLIVAAAMCIYRQPQLGEDRRRAAALAGAVLLALQIAANYWNYMYLVWVFPCLALSLLGDAFRSSRYSASDVRPGNS